LHGSKYFGELLEGLEEVPASVKDLLRLSRGALHLFEVTQRQLLGRLRNDALLAERVELLRSIPGVGEVTALTWALEVGEPERFGSIAHAVSYCGLTSALRCSAERQQRTPLSKQRNVHLQTVLIEAAKLAPRWNTQLAAVHQRELERGHRNRATLVVARKLVAYLLAVDKSRQPFQMRSPARRRDGRLRRENNLSRLVWEKQQRFASDGAAGPRRKGDCTGELPLPMCHGLCFEAGRLAPTQPSWTARSRSRKWMSGPADAWARLRTARRQSVAPAPPPTALLGTLFRRQGKSPFSLDIFLSWTSPFAPPFAPRPLLPPSPFAPAPAAGLGRVWRAAGSRLSA
jgi:hypothetical protein